MVIFIALLTTTITGIFLWLLIPHSLDVVFPGYSRTAWIAVHVYSGVMGTGVIVLYIAWHRVWLKAMRGRTLREMSAKLRANRVVDRMMWINYITMNIFGALAWLLYCNADIYAVRVADCLRVVSGEV